MTSRNGAGGGRIRKATFLLLIIAATSIPLAYAQSVASLPRDREVRLAGREKIQRDIQRAQLRYGPFYLHSALEINDLGYDSSLYAPSEKDRDDFSISFSLPQRLHLVANRKLVFSADVKPGYTWYRKATDDRHWNLRYRGDVHLIFNRLYSDFYYQRADERRRELSELNYLIDVDQDDVGNHTEIALSSRTNIGTWASYKDVDYPRSSIDSPFESPDLDRLARTETRFSGAIRHKTFPITSTEVGVAHELYNFTKGGADGQKNHVWVGSSRETNRSTLKSEIGFANLNYKEPALEDYSGPVGLVNYEYRPRERWLFTLGARRELVFSIFENNQHFAADRARTSITVPVTRFFDVRAVGEAGQNEYFAPAIDSVDGISKIRTDDVTFGSLGIVTRIRRLAVGVDVGKFKRNSNFSLLSDSGIRVVLQLSLNP